MNDSVEHQLAEMESNHIKELLKINNDLSATQVKESKKQGNRNTGFLVAIIIGLTGLWYSNTSEHTQLFVNDKDMYNYTHAIYEYEITKNTEFRETGKPKIKKNISDISIIRTTDSVQFIIIESNSREINDIKSKIE